MKIGDYNFPYYIDWSSFYTALLVMTLVFAGSVNVFAQDNSDEQDCEPLNGTPPGLYVTNDEGRTFVSKDGRTVELAPGEAAFADENRLTCIKRVPNFLDWPCTTDAAMSRKFSTYSLGDLESDNTMKEVVQRYFEIPEVIEPIPVWLEGQSHGNFNHNDIIQFSTPDYWYLPDSPESVMHEKRPKTLLIALYVGINEVVIDNYTIDAIRQESGDQLPVVFLFNDSNVVPVSYFGANVSLEEIQKAFGERRIKVADVPMWPLGDHHLKVTIAEFEKYFDIPAEEDIPASRLAALKESIGTQGFSRKPIFVTMMIESSRMVVDGPERIRAAQSMGITHIPTVVFFIEEDFQLARCGPGTPTGTSGVSGATTPIGGPIAPPGVTPPPVEPPASNSE